MGSNVVLNTWTHLTATLQGNQVKLYVNGKLEAQKTISGFSLNTARPLRIGAGATERNPDYCFPGQVAEVRIWNKARSEAEIQGDMNTSLTGRESGLVGYWPLRDGSATDYSTNGNDGTIYGDPQTAPFEQLQAATITSNTTTQINPNAHHFGKLAEVRIWGISLSDEEIAVNSKTLLSGNEPGLLAYYPMTEAIGNEVRDHSGNDRHGRMQGASWWGCAAPIGNLGHTVMQFDGKNDYVELGDFNPGNTFTVELWVKPETIDKWQCFIGKHTSEGHDIFVLGYYDNSTRIFLRDWSFWIDEVTAGDWFHLAIVIQEKQGRSEVAIYKDGVKRYSGTIDPILGDASGKPWMLGQEWNNTNSDPIKSDFFPGQMAEVRIWETARTSEEIRATMHQRLTGQETGLVGCWPLETIAQGQIPDLTGNHPGIVHEAIMVKDHTLPLGGTALVSGEYSTITVDPTTQRKSSIMRRFFASPALSGGELLTEKRIEQLQLQWIGNAQFAPTLLGYIEGAPPIPSENLTILPDYNGATSVELKMSEDVEFNWNRTQESGLGMSLDVFMGAAMDEYANLIKGTVQAAKQRIGGKGTLDLSYQFLNESNITSSSSNSMTDRLELRGNPEQTIKFPHLGKRFIPKNVGYALVISSLADVFISKLARSGKMVGYQVRPIDGIPPDVNTITFLINPAYTMNGSLDGMTGSSATSDRFFRHVPQMRSQYGSLYPASYYRLQEAYTLKQAIEREDKRRESYFQQFNARLLDESSLNREMASGAEVGSISLQRPEDQADSTLTEEERLAQEEARREQMQEETLKNKKEREAIVKQKQAEIEVND